MNFSSGNEGIIYSLSWSPGTVCLENTIYRSFFSIVWVDSMVIFTIVHALLSGTLNCIACGTGKKGIFVCGCH